MQMYDVVDEPRNHDGDPSDKFVFRFFSAVGIAWVIALLLVIGLEHTTMADDHRAQAVSEPASLASISYFPAYFAGNAQSATVADHVQAF